MKPSRTENPVARTPNTPAARSPSLKWLPSGARRRARSMRVMATVTVEATMRIATNRFTDGRRSRQDLGLRLVEVVLADHALAAQGGQLRQLVGRARAVLGDGGLDVLAGGGVSRLGVLQRVLAHLV